MYINKLNHICMSILVLGASSAYGGGDSFKVSSPVKAVEEPSTIFAYVAYGATTFDVVSEVNTFRPIREVALDDESPLFDVGLGYRWSDNIFTELSYQKSTLDIVDVSSIYASINYGLDFGMVEPFVGLLGGYSQLDWNERPHVSLVDEDFVSDQYTYGAQVGVDVSIYNGLAITAKYQYVQYEHAMSIKYGLATIDHKSGQHGMIGLKYNF